MSRTDLYADLISMAYTDHDHQIELVVSTWGNTGSGVGYKYTPENLPLGTAVSVSVGQVVLFEGKVSALAGDFSDKPATLTVTATSSGAGRKQNQVSVTHGRELRTFHGVQTAGSKRLVCHGITDGDPTLALGTTLAVHGVFSPFEGPYIVTETRHVFDQTSGYRAEFKAQSTSTPPAKTLHPAARPTRRF